MNKNIGGGVFASNRPEILVPQPYKGGELVVVPDEGADTHHLEFRRKGGEGMDEVVKRLASHPNGFSCNALAERMRFGNRERVVAQAEYLIRCGGMSDMVAIDSI